MIDVSTGLEVQAETVLQRHAVIEASAGTGKTYTIERLVSAIIANGAAGSDGKAVAPNDGSARDHSTELENILLVTFTEKAAGELKARIRDRLEKGAASDDAVVAAAFRRAVDNFDSAAIFTIHGFCHRVLKEFAFENRRPFELETGGDSVRTARLLARIVRESWPAMVSNPSVISEALQYLDGIRSAALRFRRGDLPEPMPETDQLCTDARQLAAWTVKRLVELIADDGGSVGTITFREMISGVRDAIESDNPASKSLVAILQKRYRYALVDEFQDTDPDQWFIFRKLFVEGADNRLIVVGDPKQAIYGFRGADVRTYIEAREYICEKAGGRLYRLDTNYRSSPAMIAAFNAMFCSGRWFGPDGSGITCEPCLAPNEPDRRRSFISDLSGRAALTAVSLSAGIDSAVGVPAARSKFSSFVAAETARLVNRCGILVDDAECGPRKLDYGDICVLVRGYPDVRPVLRALRSAGIPHMYYKQAGLYASAESLHTLVLLKSLAVSGPGGAIGAADARNARNKAFLTRFFGPSVGGCESTSHSVVFDSWVLLASQRNWPVLFESLQYDTGLFLREAVEPDGERRLANWRQIFGELVQTADRDSSDIHGLVAALESRRGNFDDEKDMDLHRLESESPKVKVMTIHASKGLQFPVVFIAAGFGTDSPARDGYVTGWKDGSRRYRFVASRSKPDDLPIDDDSTRLYYVAMTRAMYRLYVPTDWKPPRKGAAPLLTFIADGVQHVRNTTASGSVWTVVDGEGGVISGMADPVVGPADESPPQPDGAQLSYNLEPSVRPEWRKRRLWVDSYTSLKGLSAGRRYDVDGVSPERQDDDPDLPGFRTPVVAESPAGDRYTLLPRGALMGTAFHFVMQSMIDAGRQSGVPPFAEFAFDTGFERYDGPAIRHVERAMSRFSIPDIVRTSTDGFEPDSSRQQFLRMVKNAVTCPLPNGDGLRICDIADMVAEVEFHLDESRILAACPGVSVPQWRAGLLNGFIDVVFRHAGAYWFIDWKTTSSGPQIGGNAYPDGPWGRQSVAAMMSEHGYDLQAAIYMAAVDAWIGSGGNAASNRVGGGYFVFVRGCDETGRAVAAFAGDPDGRAAAAARDSVAGILHTSAVLAGREGR